MAGETLPHVIEVDRVNLSCSQADKPIDNWKESTDVLLWKENTRLRNL